MSPLVGCPGPGGIFVRGGLLPGGTFVRGAYARSPKFNAYTNRLGFLCVTDKQKDKLGPVAPRGVDPSSSNIQGM